jgi:hypothetical protein
LICYSRTPITELGHIFKTSVCNDFALHSGDETAT